MRARVDRKKARSGNYGLKIGKVHVNETLTYSHLTMAGNRRQCVYNHAGRVVGHIEGDKFIKNIRGSIHILHSPPAIANDVFVIDQLVAAGVKTLQIHDKETGIVYRSRLKHYLEKKIAINRGHGPQLALAIKEWTREKEGD